MDKKKLTLIFIFVPMVLLAILNLLTVFTPEIGFDALWYHLTLPKLWLFKHQWYFNGGLLYYSVMPRLTETFFIPLIHFFGYVGPKMLLYLSGLGTSIVIWKIGSRLKFSLLFKSLSISVFYCTWLVSWQSGSAYIDLFRTFIESLALLALISGNWVKGSLLLGLSIGTKWLALGSLAIYSLVFGLPILLPAFILTLPWLYIAYHFTGNPLYPILSQLVTSPFSSAGVVIKRVILLPFTLTFPFDDFISPIIFILITLSFFALISRNKDIKKIALVGILGSILSVLTNPPSSRFFLPYLPAIIVSALYVVQRFKPKFQNIFLYICIASSIFILTLRLYATNKYLPFLFGHQSTNSFLTQYADRLPDTFIDSDNFVIDNLQGSKIIIDKLHNLYYFPYDFDHTSWKEIGGNYDYLVTKDAKLDEASGKLIHTNEIGIQIFKLKQ